MTYLAIILFFQRDTDIQNHDGVILDGIELKRNSVMKNATQSA